MAEHYEQEEEEEEEEEEEAEGLEEAAERASQHEELNRLIEQHHHAVLDRVRIETRDEDVAQEAMQQAIANLLLVGGGAFAMFGGKEFPNFLYEVAMNDARKRLAARRNSNVKSLPGNLDHLSFDPTKGSELADGGKYDNFANGSSPSSTSLRPKFYGGGEAVPITGAEPGPNDELFSILIDPGSATAEEIAELLTEVSTLYRMIGGTGITFAKREVYEPAGEPV